MHHARNGIYPYSIVIFPRMSQFVPIQSRMHDAEGNDESKASIPRGGLMSGSADSNYRSIVGRTSIWR